MTTQKTRWIVQTEIELKTPLHVGTGSDKRETIDGEESWVAELALDHAERPYIPGASLKGALKSLAERKGTLTALKKLFGTMENGKTQAGQAEFHCAWQSHKPVAEEEKQARIAIDRAMGTVFDKKLFHTRVVPAKTRFALRIVVQDADEEEIAHLVSLLAAAAADPRFTLGAHGNLGLGQIGIFGRIETRRFGKEEAAVWLAALQRGDEKQRWQDYAVAADITPIAAGAANATIELPLKLEFHTPFLVKQAGDKEEGQADAIPRQRDGKVLLPASSLRGSLRSQAERILRTLGKDTLQGHEAPPYRKGSAHEDLATLLFGSAGWRGIVATADCLGSDNKTVRQELLAIDRFTGGGKDSAKFNIDYAECPTLSGQIALDLDRLRKAQLKGAKDAVWPALGLVTLLLRDLAEGDIAFGHGINKGYGQCRENQVLAAWQALLRAQFPEHGDPAGHAIAALRDWLGRPTADPIALKLDAPAKASDFKPTRSSGKGFHNPYHFIPLVKPDTSQWPSLDKVRTEHGHDRYQGLSGRIVCKLTPKTPLFIGSERGKAATPDSPIPVSGFQLQNELAIPATSLRGMLSSLFESISGSNFRVLEAEKYSMRKSFHGSLSAIGRIVMHEGKPKLFPLTLPTIDLDEDYNYTIPQKWSKMFEWDPVALRVYFDPFGGRTYSCAEPYYMRFEEIDYDAERQNQVAQHNHLRFPKGGRDKRYLIGQDNAGEQPISQAEFDKLSEKERAGLTRGWVRTLRAKGRDLPGTVRHHLFVPDITEGEIAASALITIDDSVVEKFNDLADLALANKHFKDDDRIEEIELLPYTPVGRRSRPDGSRLTRLQEGDLVFFDIDKQGNITEIAFSSMWRQGIEKQDKQLATTADLVANFDANLLPYGMAGRSEALSPAELLFGLVEDRLKDSKEEQAVAYAGKVRVGYGTIGAGKKVETLPEITLKELSTPKPPSPALYFRKLDRDGYVSKTDLAKNVNLYTLRGRKTYLHAWREGNEVVKLGDKGLRDEQRGRFPWASKHHGKADNGNNRRVQVKPIKAGQDFYFEIDFHKLSEKELQQLCATLQPDPSFEHRLGMGKPIGLGSVKLEPQGIFLVNRKQRYATDTLDAARYHAGQREQNAADWPARLKTELEARLPEASPSVSELARKGMESVAEDVRRALQLLGTPEAIGVPVHYPQVQGGEMEKEQFAWFMANDKTDRNAPADNQQSLTRITAASVRLEPLLRIDTKSKGNGNNHRR